MIGPSGGRKPVPVALEWLQIAVCAPSALRGRPWTRENGHRPPGADENGDHIAR